MHSAFLFASRFSFPPQPVLAHNIADCISVFFCSKSILFYLKDTVAYFAFFFGGGGLLLVKLIKQFVNFTWNNHGFALHERPFINNGEVVLRH